VNHFPLSIIVLNWNGGKQLKACLKSLLESDYDDLEIFVSDNGSKDGSDRFIEQKYPFIKLVRNGKNLGFSKGNNVVIAKTKGNIVVFSNNDVTVKRDAVAKIAEVFEDPTVGAATGVICHPNSYIVQNAGVWLHSSGHIIPNLALEDISDSTRYVSKIVDVDAAQGAFLAIRRTLLKQIGFFDENLWAFYEDIDICTRVKKAGYRVVIRLDCIIWHERSASWKRSLKLQLRKEMLRDQGRFYFLMKYHGLGFLWKSGLLELSFWVGHLAKLLMRHTETQRYISIASTSILSKRETAAVLRLLILVLLGKLMAIFGLPKVIRAIYTR